MSGSAGKVALTRDATPLSGACPVSPSVKLMVDAGRVAVQQARIAGQRVSDRRTVIGFEVAEDDVSTYVDEDVEVPRQHFSF